MFIKVTNACYWVSKGWWESFMIMEYGLALTLVSLAETMNVITILFLLNSLTSYSSIPTFLIISILNYLYFINNNKLIFLTMEEARVKVKKHKALVFLSFLYVVVSLILPFAIKLIMIYA